MILHTVSYKLILSLNFVSRNTKIITFIALVAYYIVIVGINLHFVPVEREFHGIVFYLLFEPSFWLMVIGGAVAVMVPDIIYNKMYEVMTWTPVKEKKDKAVKDPYNDPSKPKHMQALPEKKDDSSFVSEEEEFSEDDE
jgi:hypothetical protein